MSIETIEEVFNNDGTPKDWVVKQTINKIIDRIGQSDYTADAQACACLDYWNSMGIDVSDEIVRYQRLHLENRDYDTWLVAFTNYYMLLEEQYGEL